MLEQLFSPIIVHTTPEHAELIEIGKRCLTKFHAYHYLGFRRDAVEALCEGRPAPRESRCCTSIACC